MQAGKEKGLPKQRITNTHINMSDRLPKQKKLISISEAAGMLDVSIDTIRRWDKSGLLHSERPDGKNRYFSLTELEKFKLNQPLSISDVARKLNISPTTLRRLEVRDLIKPKRNSAGERIYDEALLENFLNSPYFLRKKQLKEKVSESLAPDEKPIESTIPKRRINEFITVSTVLFTLLLALGLRNIWIAEFRSAETSSQTTPPQVLSTTTYTEPEVSPEPEIVPEPEITPDVESEATPEAKPLVIVRVKAEGSSSVNIRQEPTVDSKELYQVKNGEIFEFISKDSDWFKVKLASDSAGFISAGFISAEYAEEID